VLARVFAWIGPLEGLAAMTSFLFAYWLAGWRPWDPLADSGTLYYEATTMTMAGIVMAQVGAGLGWRTAHRPLAAVGLFSNRLLLVGIALEVGMIALLAYTPGLGDLFHTSAIGVWEWLLLLVWPPLVLGAEEARKSIVRRRSVQR
jgi:magnesium-transporting ATPase (P-type)